MKKRRIQQAITAAMAVAALLACGASTDPAESRADVEAAVERHLAAKTDLDLTNMTIEVLEVDYADETASTLVRIQARDNSDALMELRYQLRRGDDGWEVVEQARSGDGSQELPSGHPPVDDSNSQSETELPPGHPPINR